jgi:hypothetical protein
LTITLCSPQSFFNSRSACEKLEPFGAFLNVQHRTVGSTLESLLSLPVSLSCIVDIPLTSRQAGQVAQYLKVLRTFQLNLPRDSPLIEDLTSRLKEWEAVEHGELLGA